jgi:MerR family mercuric resistance operon transcriptional regulator
VNAYTSSRLAEDAGVSQNVVRDYIIRGLLHPVRRTESGYCIFDERSLERLRFLRTAFESGIALEDLKRLCRALDADDEADVTRCVEPMLRHIASRQALLSAARDARALLTQFNNADRVPA